MGFPFAIEANFHRIYQRKEEDGVQVVVRMFLLWKRTMGIIPQMEQNERVGFSRKTHLTRVHGKERVGKVFFEQKTSIKRLCFYFLILSPLALARPAGYNWYGRNGYEKDGME